MVVVVVVVVERCGSRYALEFEKWDWVRAVSNVGTY